MKINTITPTFSTSGEMTEKAFNELVKSSVTTLINVRPDHESPEQRNTNEWEELCKVHGLKYFHIPVSPCQYPEKDIQQFKYALNSKEEKVHGFCRTGARAAHLFALAKKEEYSFEQMQALLKDKGYDLSPIEEQYKDKQ